ncbi:AMP-binding protein [Mesorhizobium retamae]|uniref:AMP-binding protein n=1 Tax=Mesorhizobium retamae TaxID=2912854 RepID=A0ABS9QDA3_9HYPH|nr:AMP-binding protein [Mesorhizobium sp. IRAMC:0171]MCG7505399.1 AMP-binding protein [Mesorhizobium sp. IRAMC:0171]
MTHVTTNPTRETSVISAMLDAEAARHGDRTLIVFDSGDTWSYSETRRRARRKAAALGRLGVKKGDAVLVWLPSGPTIFTLHLALSYLGAIFVPLNLALKGSVLQHVVSNSGANLVICHADLVDRLAAIDTCKLDSMVVVGGPRDLSEKTPALRELPELALASDDEDFVDGLAQPWEPHGIFYTSGTTGPSKGVICPHVHTAVMSRHALRFLVESDRFMINMPYFHLAGALVPFAVIERGASMSMITRFRTQTFWDDVRRTESTVCYILDSIRTFLMKQPPDARDRDNPMRVVVQQPLSHDSLEFADRFGLTVYTQWDMTELLPVIMSEAIGGPRPPAKGYCGKAGELSPRSELRIVDDHDCEVPDGQIGELIVRCEQPWVISPGYWGNPEATARSWRSGWFHTGDLFRKDSEGNFYYVDRTKDSIRRRGENVSSSEVEADVLGHPDVHLAAAIAVPSEHSEDEVMVVVKAKPDRSVDPAELFEFLVPRMPHYMLPRFIRVVEEFAMTETIKIRKNVLRDEGVTPDTWDRERAGIVVKAQRIGER